LVTLCPSCQHSISFKEAKPGRYTPKCPKCSTKFLLVVPNDPDAQPVASALAGEGGSTAATLAAAGNRPAAEPERTGACIPSPVGAADRTGAFVAPPTADPNATAAHVAASDFRTRADQPEATRAHTTAAGVPDPSAGLKPTRTANGGQGASAVDETSGFDLGGGAAAAPNMDVPSTLGGYQMLKELGRGGMGAVYLARQMSLDRNVAVKVMRPEWARDPIFVARFTREAFAAAQLVHHNVVQIHDIGTERDTNFFSMEFVEGESLGDMVKREGNLDAEVAVGYILQAARGLAVAHEQGMVHRDIKPDNLMLNRHGIVKVADLGIVKTPGAAEADRQADEPSAPRKINPSAPTQVTMAGIAMGTPAYMAPEQARDAAKVDARADIYSLGCSLYVLVTGRLADRDEQFETLSRGESPFVAELRDRDTSHEFHDKERLPTFGRPGIQYLGDVWMVHHRQRLPFRLKSRNHLPCVHAGFEHFERHSAANRLLLLGDENDAKSPFANLLDQRVRSDLRARPFADRLADRGRGAPGGRLFEEARIFFRHLKQGDHPLVQRRVVPTGLPDVGDSGVRSRDFQGDFENLFLNER